MNGAGMGGHLRDGDVRNLGLLGIEYRQDRRPAVIDLWDPDNPRVIDYPEYHAGCDAVARGLIERGLQRADRVGILCSNRVEFLQIFYGAMRGFRSRADRHPAAARPDGMDRARFRREAGVQRERPARQAA
jgi:hypothetical protein